MARNSDAGATAQCEPELYLDHGRDKDLIDWFAELGGDNDARLIWKNLLEQVLAEENVPVDAFRGVGLTNKKRMAVRLRVHSEYYPCIVRVWRSLPRGERSSMLIAALRQAMIEARAGNRMIRVSVFTGDLPPHVNDGGAQRRVPEMGDSGVGVGEQAVDGAVGSGGEEPGEPGLLSREADQNTDRAGVFEPEPPEMAVDDPFSDSLLESVGMMGDDEPDDD